LFNYTGTRSKEDSVAVNDEDKQAFADATRDVDPIRPSDRVTPSRRKPKPNARMSRHARRALIRDSLNGRWSEAATGEVEFSQPGVSRQTMRRLREGRFSIEAELDLHGLTRAQAQLALKDFVRDCIDQRMGCVRVIHGKGTRSGPGGPVLKSSVHGWLAQWEEVLAYASARHRHGGSGAIYVLLRGG
jgi:DNA-nicking Smr family endonuclease